MSIITEKQESELVPTTIPIKGKKIIHYVNNSDFLVALVEYKKLCRTAKKEGKIKPQIPNYIGECFLKIADHLSRKPNFVSYTFRDDMIADGVENCLMYFENFNVKKSKNPFAYFTQIIYFAFLRKIAKEKKQMYVKYKSAQNHTILNEEEIQELEELGQRHFELYDNISEFIFNFEQAKEKKRKEKVKKKEGLEKFAA